MKKHLVAVGLVSAAGLAGITGAGYVYATDASTKDSSGPMDSLVTALSEKFNLNKDEVQQVFDEQRSAMEQQQEDDIKNELAQLVDGGTLTQDQADALLAKRAELQATRQANRESRGDDTTTSKDDRKAAMDAQRTELQSWAKEQGIDAQYLRFVMGHGGRGHGDMMRADSDQSKSSTSTDANADAS